MAMMASRDSATCSPRHPRSGAGSADISLSHSGRHLQAKRSLFETGRSSILGNSPVLAVHTSGSAASLKAEHGNEASLPFLPRSPPQQEKRQQLSKPVKMNITPLAPPLSLPPLSLPRVEKDIDDPTTPSSSSRGQEPRETTTLNTLSRLFAAQTDSTSSPACPHRTTDMPQPQGVLQCSRSVQGAETLPEHLYNRGLVSGRHSDITVNAFGNQYKLHRLILDRAPFFASALNGPWVEANAKEMTVHPTEIDNAITPATFELALKRLYGNSCPEEEHADPIGLFAVGCWLEMQDLIESAIECILRQMRPEMLSPLIRLVTNSYYGRSGERVLASAKSMLCRDGWKMPLRCWDGIPGDVVREIVGGDGFYIMGELDRWILAKRILDRRLKVQAFAAGLAQPGSRKHVLKAPDRYNLMAVRFDSVYRKNGAGAGRALPAGLDRWIACYTHPEVEPLLVLLDEGIHYAHLEFEQMQLIRNAKDCFGLPVMSDKVISNALWQQMELRQRIVNARESDLEIGLRVQYVAQPTTDNTCEATSSVASPTISTNGEVKGKGKEAELHEAPSDMLSGSWDENGKSRKFWIPGSDCNIVMGGTPDPVVAPPNNIIMQRHPTQMASVQPEDVQWVADFSAAVSTAAAQSRPTPTDSVIAQPLPEPTLISYTYFPPFRFAAEFPNPRLLKDRKRVYSRTVFYAGSLWNLYIQKVASPKSKQLGVYLHRAKDREPEESTVSSLTTGNAVEQTCVTELTADLGDDRDYLTGHQRKSSHQDNRNTIPAITTTVPMDEKEPTKPVPKADDSADPDNSSDEEDDDYEFVSATSDARMPALTPYIDARPTIKTYFKIYSPSRGGRMLSAYESAPDKFNFSQSWGWKSSNLMLDEGLASDEMDVKDESLPNSSAPSGTDKDTGKRSARAKGDGRLRFMVVIGNI